MQPCHRAEDVDIFGRRAKAAHCEDKPAREHLGVRGQGLRGIGIDQFRDKRLEFGIDAPSTCTQARSEEHTSELQSLMRISYAVFCLTKKYQTLCHHQITAQVVPSYSNLDTSTDRVPTRLTHDHICSTLC